jgi:hypothetical protein
MTSNTIYTVPKSAGSFGTSGKAAPWPSEFTPTGSSKRELIDIWFLEPLRRMDGHQGFICLSSCLLLYEKYLKKTNQIGNTESFSQGHRVFKQIGKDFGISRDDAYEFWTCWRNGFAHHGLPKKSKRFDWGLTGNQDRIVCISDSSFVVNPWLMRDKILNKIEQKKFIWDDELAPLMRVFRIIEP